MPSPLDSAEPDLTKEQRKALDAAIADAFTHTELNRLLYLEMEEQLAQITLGASGGQVQTMLLQWLERTGRVREFVTVAIQQNPGNKKLHAVAKELGLIADAPPKERLQRMLKEFAHEFDMSESLPQSAQFERMLEAFARELALRPAVQRINTAPQGSAPSLERVIQTNRIATVNPLMVQGWIADASRRVCLIERDDQPYGTGFLVGPDLVLTAYHVVENALKTDRFDALSCRFDYVITQDGKQSGERLELSAETPCLHHAAHAQIDLTHVAWNNTAADEPYEAPIQQTSHALLKLATPVSAERGWFSLAQPTPIEKNMHVYIMHHPRGMVLKLSLPAGKVHRIAQNMSRIEYINTPTAAGSSGAPVLNSDGKPIALHFAKNRAVLPPDGIGIGVPLTLIRTVLLDAGIVLP